MDQKLLFLINREWTGPVLDRLMAAMSSATLWAVPLAIVCLVLLYRGGLRARAFVVLALIAFGINDGVVGRAVKKTVGRMRPHQTEAGVRMLDLKAPAIRGLFGPLKEKVSLGSARYGPGVEGRSFPSNHASNTVAVAVVAAVMWNWGWLAFIPALLVAYSRVYVGAHWPTDVAAGVCIGVSVAVFVLVAAELIWRKCARRFAPGAAAQRPSLLFA